MPSKKILIVIAILLGLGLFSFWLLSPASTPTPPTPTPVVSTPGPSPDFTNYVLPTPPIATIAANTDYKISHNKEFNTYAIIIYSRDFHTVRAAAELALLSQLKLAQANACKLKVSISSPFFVTNPSPAPYYTTFSFCSPTSTP